MYRCTVGLIRKTVGKHANVLVCYTDRESGGTRSLVLGGLCLSTRLEIFERKNLYNVGDYYVVCKQLNKT